MIFNVNTIKFKAQIRCHSGRCVQSLSVHVDTCQTVYRYATSKFPLLLLLFLPPPPLLLLIQMTPKHSKNVWFKGLLYYFYYYWPPPLKFSFKLALYIENLHCSVRFIISDTALKFSALIHYHQTSPFFFEM